MGRPLLVPAILFLIILAVAGIIIFIPTDTDISVPENETGLAQQNTSSTNGNGETNTDGRAAVNGEYSQVTSPQSQSAISGTSNTKDSSGQDSTDLNGLMRDKPGVSPDGGISGKEEPSQNTALQTQISGMVVNSFQKPIVSASVMLDNGETVQTGQDGRFVFRELDSGAYNLTVNAEGYRPLSREAIDTGTNNFTLVLVSDGMLQGKVIDNTDAPVAFANISIRAVEGIYIQEIRSDAEGRFTLKNPPAEQRLNVRASQENFSDEGEGHRVVDPPFNEFVVLRLTQPSYSISGMIINEETGQGMSDFHLIAVQEDGSNPEPMQTQSRGGGLYRFDNLKPGTYIVSSNPTLNEQLNVVVPVDQDYKTVKVLERDARDVNFPVESGITVSGVVVNQNNQPVGGAEVTVAKIPSTKTLSNFNGEFVLRNVPSMSPGGISSRGISDIRLLASHQQYGSGTSDPLPVGTGNPVNNITIVLEGFATLSGTVTDQNGAAVFNARLVLVDLSTGAQREQTTGPDGSFVFDEISVAFDESNTFTGTHRVSVFHDQYAPLHQQVSVQSGQNKSLQLTLDSGNQISGQVTDTEGNPVPGVTVRAQLPRGGIASAQSDEIGTYQFPNLPPGQYNLHFRLDSNPPLTTVLYGIHAGTTGANAVLKPGEWRVTGTVLDAQTGEPVRFYQINIQGNPHASGSRSFIRTKTVNSPNGTYQLTFTEPGEYEMLFTSENYQSEVGKVDIRPEHLSLQYINIHMTPVNQFGTIRGMFNPPPNTQFAGVNVVGVGQFPANGNAFELTNLPVGPNNLLFYVMDEGGAPRPVGGIHGVMVKPDSPVTLGTIGADILNPIHEF